MLNAFSFAAFSQSVLPPSAPGTNEQGTTANISPRHPVEVFARLPLLSRVVLSPDGRQIAALINHGDQTLLIARPITESEPKILAVSDNKQLYFNWVRWVNNERLVFSTRFVSRRDAIGTVETRLLSIKADGSELLRLVPDTINQDGGLARVSTQQIQDEVIDWLPEEGEHLLLQLSEPGGVLPSVYKIDVRTGDAQVVKGPERDVYQWMTDSQHRVRVGVRNREGSYEILARDPDGGSWRTLWSFSDMKDAVWPLGFGLDPQELFIQANHDGRMAVFSVRLDQPGLPRSLRLADPQVDIDGVLLRSPATGEVLGLSGGSSGSEGDEPHPEFWNPAWRAVIRSIDLGLPNRDNLLVGLSRDEQRYLLFSSGNGMPGEYYLGDRRTGEVTLIGETYPDLAPEMLVGKRPVTIKARDGLALNAYLSLPKGRRMGDGGTPLPMVLLPHGGPQSRDDDDFDPWTEFLADRGYAVLQVNFRGSDGYGVAFKSAGLKRWGLEMQDDLTDAVRWATANKLADASRICIVGASYGGYAALMGVVKTPELYRCAISFAGVSNLQDQIEFDNRYVGGRASAERVIGEYWGDRERLHATSPALHADGIRVPVLLVHGTDDRVVPVEQSRDMANALRRAGKTYRYIEQEAGDHQLSSNAQRLQFFQAMESFLDENLRTSH